MADTVNIGGDSEKTWACVRAPIWPGSGLTLDPDNYPYLMSENWSPRMVYSYLKSQPVKDSGYPYALTGLVKAYPIVADLSPDPGRVHYTAMGVKFVGASEETYDCYLSLGEGYNFGGVYDQVANYVAYGTSAQIGYDYETTKGLLLGATANVTIDGTSYDVTIGSEMFPDDIYAYSEGVYITNISTSSAGVWTINSVTLP